MNEFAAAPDTVGAVQMLADPVSGNGRVEASAAPLLVAERLTKRWQRGRLTVLESVDLALERGTLVSVFGANG